MIDRLNIKENITLSNKNTDKKSLAILALPLGISIGVSVGLMIGSAAGNIPIGMCIGMAVGSLIGLLSFTVLHSKSTKQDK